MWDKHDFGLYGNIVGASNHFCFRIAAIIRTAIVPPTNSVAGEKDGAPLVFEPCHNADDISKLGSGESSRKLVRPLSIAPNKLNIRISKSKNKAGTQRIGRKVNDCCLEFGLGCNCSIHGAPSSPAWPLIACPQDHLRVKCAQ